MINFYVFFRECRFVKGSISKIEPAVSGSHVYLHKWDHEQNNWMQRVTVPVHGYKILKLGTLKNILSQSDVDVEKLLDS